jgi:hypothetical protein
VAITEMTEITEITEEGIEETAMIETGITTEIGTTETEKTEGEIEKTGGEIETEIMKIVKINKSQQHIRS